MTPPHAALEIVPAGPLVGALAAPASKSVTNRLLVIAALAEGESVLGQPLESDDTAAMRDVVRALGAELAVEDEGWRVVGTGGLLRAPGAAVDCRLSGTTMRFGTALAALADGAVTLTGAPPLLRRPIRPLVEALRRLGADVADSDGHPPLRVAGGLHGGEVRVDLAASTQFASAVLLVAPYTAVGVRLRTSGTGACGYVDVTAAVMRRWGAGVEHRWDVAPGGYRARRERVEYDASAAAHLYALAVATGGRVTVTNAADDSRQPDVAILDVLRAMGATVERSGDAVSVTGPQRPAAVDADLRALPDQVTTVAALAALAPGPSRISGVGVVRGHETDRLRALAGELGRLGVRVEEQPAGLIVHGGAPRGPARLATHDDHRLAMAFAAVGARVPGVVVEDPQCVRKTYPRFWDDAASLGMVSR